MKFNVENCSEGWSRDDLLSGYVRPTCDLNITAFYVIIGIAFVVQFVLLVLRTNYILERARVTKKPLVRAQYVTIALSALTALSVLAMLIVPTVTPISGNNAMLVLIAVEMFAFAMVMIIWTKKILRLNFRIILREIPEMKSILSSAANKKDRAILAGILLGQIFACCFLFFNCVLCMIYPYNIEFTKAGLGFLGLFMLVMTICSVYQTERCCAVIIQSYKGVQNILADGVDVGYKYELVIRKFRIQQAVTLFLGITGTILSFLCVGLPLINEMYITAVVLDACGAVGMMGSLLCCCVRGNQGRTSKRTTNEDSGTPTPRMKQKKQAEEGQATGTGGSKENAVVAASSPDLVQSVATNQDSYVSTVNPEFKV